MKPSKKYSVKYVIIKIFKYLEPLWTGIDGKISLRATGAMCLMIDLISNIHEAVYKWEAGKSFEGLSLVLGIEAGLIAALLGLTAYANMAAQKIESQAANPSTDTSVKIQNVDKITVEQPKTTDAKISLD